MKFGNLLKAVHEAWQFAWPPVAMCFIFYFTANFLDPSGTRMAVVAVFDTARSSGKEIEALHTVLQPYGLNLLIPTVSAIVVVAFLYVLNGPVSIAASKLPPKLYWMPQILVLRSARTEEMLLLLRKFPTNRNLESSYDLARASLLGFSAPAGRTSFNFKIADLIKFAFLCSVLLSISNVRAGLSVGGQAKGVLFLIVVIVCLWSVNFVVTLKNLEQDIYADWQKVRVELEKEASVLMASKPAEDEDRIVEEYRTSAPTRWWGVSVIDHSWAGWALRTFFPARVFKYGNIRIERPRKK